MSHIVRDHCLAPERVDAPIYGGRYRSLFEDLPPLGVDEHALHALGRPGGPCDPARIRNFRVPRANLEGVYGAGPVGSPYLYTREDAAKLVLSPSGDDVPRNHEGIALIGDPRNDVHLFTSQMLVAFIKLHNRLVDRLRDDGAVEQEVFDNRDLQRGHAVGLASGEAVARRLGVPALSAAQIGLAERGWAGETPLWFYILKEADVMQDGDQLGPVGGRIVGEVLVGIIDGDPESFRSVEPDWSPTLPARHDGAFGLADILAPVY